MVLLLMVVIMESILKLNLYLLIYGKKQIQSFLEQI
jgi:hypothetical protein